MDKIRVGISGLGVMGSRHIQSIQTGKVPDMELSALADPLVERREWAASNFPGIPVYNDGSELIKSGKCDAVIIATPHYLHPTYSIEALNAGLHVMCEKPAGVYTKQVREMNEIAAKSGKVFGIMFQYRIHPIFMKMHELVQGGTLGAIKRVNWIITNWYRPQAYYDSGSWRATWDGEGGGVLLNQCPHNLDVLQWICGMPNSVRAFCHNGKWHNIEVEDDVTAYLEYPNGATGSFITSTGDLPGTNRFEVTLEWGKLVNENNTDLILYKLDKSERDYIKAPVTRVRDTTVPEKIEVNGKNEGTAGILDAFAGKILRDTPLIVQGQEGINGLTLSNAMHLSSWLDTTVKLPIDEDLFLAELTKRRALTPKK